MRNINEQLYALYSEKWGKLGESLQESVENDPTAPTNPLLLYVDSEEAWLNADLRVMIFGQETMDWCDVFTPKTPIRTLREEYDNFYNKGKCWKRASNFWNGLKLFKKLLGEKFPDRKIQYLWNDIIKIGKAGEAHRPPEEITARERRHFNVIPDEVSILKPNMALFLTGPDYDKDIRAVFGEVGYAPIPSFEEKQLARLSIPAMPTVKSAFRTYHPRHLYQQHYINDYFGAIVAQVE